MIIYYSGTAGKHSNPEVYLKKNKANIMLTYFNSTNKKPEKRFLDIYKIRKQKLREEKQNVKDK